MQQDSKQTMNRNDEISVELLITDFSCDPTEISKLLNIEPSRTWLKGDPIGQKGFRKYKENGLIMEFKQQKAGETPSQLLDRLLTVVAPNTDKFKDLPAGTVVEISTIIYLYDSTFGLNLSSDQIKALANLNASIDVDLYRLE